MIVHGHSKRGSQSITYRTWCQMKARCYNPKHAFYYNYGGRGITVCKRWLESFKRFLADMGERPSAHHSIERKNGNASYSPSNCKWSTRKEQARNTKRNRHITIGERTQLMADWAAEYGISSKIICKRILNYGWSPEKAVITPVRYMRKPADGPPPF